MTRAVGLETYDVRFPTSRSHDGSHAAAGNPDYAFAYLIVCAGREGIPANAAGVRRHDHAAVNSGINR